MPRVCDELAERTGIAQSTISAIETNRIKLGAERAKTLARSPGVRASLEDAGLAPAWASERQREREEVEYRAFVEERMGRLSEGRRLAD